MADIRDFEPGCRCLTCGCRFPLEDLFEDAICPRCGERNELTLDEAEPPPGSPARLPAWGGA